MSTWNTGDAVVLRYLVSSNLRWVKPVRVVEDSSSCVALFLAAGTTIKKPVNAVNGEPIDRSLSYGERFRPKYRLADGEWSHNSVLMLCRPEAAHAFWAFWRAADWSFLGWYVNFQEPLRRTPIGFDTADHVLDLVIAPDLSSWKWKDEDEFEEACALGRFTETEVAAIRAESVTALRIVRERGWPLAAQWAQWRPYPGWTIPRFRAGWEVLS